MTLEINIVKYTAEITNNEDDNPIAIFYTSKKWGNITIKNINPQAYDNIRNEILTYNEDIDSPIHTHTEIRMSNEDSILSITTLKSPEEIKTIITQLLMQYAR